MTRRSLDFESSASAIPPLRQVLLGRLYHVIGRLNTPAVVYTLWSPQRGTCAGRHEGFGRRRSDALAAAGQNGNELD